MLKISISLVAESGSTWTLPDHLHKEYLELQKHEKAVAKALRSFRSVPTLPHHLEGFQDKVLDLLPKGAPKGLRVEALRNRIVKIGPTGNPVGGQVDIILNERLT